MRLGLCWRTVLVLAVGCGGSTGASPSGPHKDAGGGRASSGKPDGSSAGAPDAAGPKGGADAGASCNGACDDGVDCTDDACSSSTGQCTHVPNHAKCRGQAGALCDRTLGCGLLHCVKPADCDDGVFCNGAEQCVAGQCAAGSAPAVADGVDCTKDTCEEPNRIRHMADDKACDDGKFCNGQEHCDLKTGCQPGTAPALDDAIDCTLDSCDESTHQASHTPVDSLCDDGDSCTRDRCAIGSGCTHAHDGNACPCTPSGTCDPFAASSTCTAEQTCRAGASGSTCEALGSPMLLDGAPCPGAPDQLACAPGLLCTDFGAGLTCMRMCRRDTVGLCPSGQACTGMIKDEACVGICRPFPTPCDPVAQDCSDPNDTCTFAVHPETGAPYTGCRPIGTRTRGQTCGGSVGSCGHRQVCLSSAGVATCYELCDPAGVSLPCTDPAQSCTGRSTLYGASFCQ